MNVKCFVLIIGMFILVCATSVLNGQDIVLETQEDVDAFDSSITVINGGLRIGKFSEASNIVDVMNLANIIAVDGNLAITWNVELVDINGLKNINSVGGIQISDNPNLVTVEGLSGVASVLNNMYITQNESLIHINGLRSISSVGGRVSISYNKVLDNIDGVSNLLSLGEDLYIVSNDSLKNINGLKGLTSILESVDIVFNKSLSNIDGLINVNSIGDRIFIMSNSSLENLDGMSNVAEIENSLRISNNNSLTDCCGVQHLLESNSFEGFVEILNNPSECSSQEEILDADCSVSAKELTELEWNITPSITTTGSQVRIESDSELQNLIIELRNTNGQLIISSNSNMYIEVPSNISSGLYFVSIFSAGKKSTKRIIIQ